MEKLLSEEYSGVNEQIKDLPEQIHGKRKEISIDDNDEEQPTTSNRKRKRLIGFDDTKDRCGCRKGCSKRSCPCFKSTNGCNSSCKCKTSCENLFNHLDYIFGKNSECSPHPCFTDWLIKNVKNANGVKQIDRDALREQIMKSGRYSELLDEEDFREWIEKWKQIEEKDRLAHTQKFFRMLLSDEASPRYYSFCNKDIAEQDCDWHCTICKGCRDWREWHCDGCNKCAYGTTMPCPRCERDEDNNDFFSFW